MSKRRQIGYGSYSTTGSSASAAWLAHTAGRLGRYAAKQGIKRLLGNDSKTEEKVKYEASKPIDPVRQGVSAGLVNERSLRPVTIPLSIKTKAICQPFNAFKQMFDRNIKMTHQFSLSKSSELGQRGYFFMNFRHDYFHYVRKITASGGGTAGDVTRNLNNFIFPNGGDYGHAASPAATTNFHWLSPQAETVQYEGTNIQVSSPTHPVVDGQVLLAGLNKCFLAETSYRLSPSIVKQNWSGTKDDTFNGTTLPSQRTLTWNTYNEQHSSFWAGGRQLMKLSDQDVNTHFFSQNEANNNEPYKIRNDGGMVMLNFSNQGEAQVVIDIVVFKAKDNYQPKVQKIPSGVLPETNNDDISKEIFESARTSMRNWIDQNKLSKNGNMFTGNYYGDMMEDMNGHVFSETAGFDDPRMKFLPKLSGFDKTSGPAYEVNQPVLGTGYYKYNQQDKIASEIGRISIVLDIGERRKIKIPLRKYELNCADNTVPSTYMEYNVEGVQTLKYLDTKLRDGLWPGETVCLAIGQRGVEIPVAPIQSGNTASGKDFTPVGLQAAPSTVIITGEYIENVHSMLPVETIEAPYYNQNLAKTAAIGDTVLTGIRKIPLENIIRRPMDFGSCAVDEQVGIEEV